MKKLDKILLFFISLIFLGLSVCVLSLFYPLPIVSDVVKYNLTAFPWLNYAFVGYSAIMCLCFFILLLTSLFFTNKSNFLIITRSKGEIQFSKKTIESTVRYSFADLDGISSSKIRIRINKKPDKTKVYVKLSLNDTKALALLTETLQEKIASSMQASLGITVKSITVRVTELNPNNTAKKENIEDISEKDRII